MTMRIIVFGDSIGQGDWDMRGGGWVQRVRQDYARAYIASGFMGNDYYVLNVSISGDTTNQILDRMDADITTRTLHGETPLIVIAVGTNDARIDGQTPVMSLQQYATNIGKLIDKAAEYAAREHILVVGLPGCDEPHSTPLSWAPSTFTNVRLLEFETAARQVSEAGGVVFVPLVEVFMQHMQAGKDLFSDALHPNDVGHELIYTQVKPAIDAVLQA